MSVSAANLSLHLSEAEFLSTSHRAFVAEQAQKWAESPAIQTNARRFAATVFEPVRELLGHPLHVNSGFRCGGLNTEVGGRPTSRHVLGLAADVVPVGVGLETAYRIVVAAMRAGNLSAVDEAIIEMGWVHIQAAPPGVKARGLALVTGDGVHFERFA